jgi:hypothetical protein
MVKCGVKPPEKSAADNDLSKRIRLPEVPGDACINMSTLTLSQAALLVSQDS